MHIHYTSMTKANNYNKPLSWAYIKGINQNKNCLGYIQVK